MVGVRDGEVVRDGEYHWKYHTLTWHQRAGTGMDFYGCYVYAVIDGDRLRVQHGENPEAVRWFTLDELNRVGKSWDCGDPAQWWFYEIHSRQQPERSGA